MNRSCFVLLLSVNIIFGSFRATYGVPPLVGASLVVKGVLNFAGIAFTARDLYELFAGDGGERVDELGARLKAIEDVLSETNSATLEKLRKLREDLDERTTREAFESALREAMRELEFESDSVLRNIERKGEAALGRLRAEMSRIESRMSSLESRQTNMERRQDMSEQRWDDYESSFGAVPRIAPKPYEVLLGNEPNTEIYTHPRLIDFVRLLIRSEVSRMRLDALRRSVKANSKVFTSADAEDKLLCESAMQLHTDLAKEVEDYRNKEKELLATFDESHFSVSDLRRTVSSLLWLHVASKPVEDKENGRLRLGVPKVFANDECVRVFGAYKDAGGDVVDFRPLVEFQLEQAVFAQQASISRGVVTAAPGDYQTHLAQTSQEYRKHVLDLQSSSIEACAIEFQLTRSLGTLSPKSRDATALIIRKQKLLDEVKRLSAESERLSSKAVKGYCRLLCEHKPNSIFMTQLRDRLVVPSLCSRKLLICQSWESTTAKEKVWQRLVTYAPSLAVEEIDNVSQGPHSSDRIFFRELHELQLDRYYRHKDESDLLQSRGGSYRFSVGEQGKVLRFYAAEGDERVSPQQSSSKPTNRFSLTTQKSSPAMSPGKPHVFESLEFDSPIVFFDGGAPYAVGLNDDGVAFLASNNNPKNWPKDRLPREIPANVQTATVPNGKPTLNPDNLDSLPKGRIVIYEGWEIKRRLTFSEKPRSLAFVDTSRVAALHKGNGRSIVTLYDWSGQLFGTIPCSPSIEVEHLSSDGNWIFAIDKNGELAAVWAIELFLRLKA